MMTGTTPVLSKIYVFDPRPHFPFQIVAKRYWTEDCLDVVSKLPEGLHTLVFVSGNGTHKEHWEPTIHRLFEHQEETPAKTTRLHDAWALDMPNQGDSAVLNEEVLHSVYDVFSWENYTRSVHAFLAGLGTGVDVDFSKRKLALVGHSLACDALLLVTTYYPTLQISSLHLFEPTLGGDHAKDHGYQLAEMIEKRNDIWRSSEDFGRELSKRQRKWDKRIQRMIVQHGLRPLPTAEYPDLKEGVTTKCSKRQLCATYKDCVTKGVAYRYLPHVLKDIPTHITYGNVIDFIPKEWQRDTLHFGSGGISNFASATIVHGAGHMILQTHPDTVADVLWKSLTSPKNTVVAKL